VAGLFGGHDRKIQPSESTFVGVASEEPISCCQDVALKICVECRGRGGRRTCSRLPLSRSRKNNLLPSSTESVEKCSNIDLSPTVVVRHNNTNSLRERQKSHKERSCLHLEM
jgi:hypothetical protein